MRPFASDRRATVAEYSTIPLKIGGTRRQGSRVFCGGPLPPQSPKTAYGDNNTSFDPSLIYMYIIMIIMRTGGVAKKSGERGGQKKEIEKKRRGNK